MHTHFLHGLDEKLFMYGLRLPETNIYKKKQKKTKLLKNLYLLFVPTENDTTLLAEHCSKPKAIS